MLYHFMTLGLYICCRSVFEACVWYYDHLVGQIPLVILTTEEKVSKHMYLKFYRTSQTCFGFVAFNA